MKTKEDCYIYSDNEIPEDQRTISILCEKCHLKFPNLGWFWEGSKLGYGPYDFICSKCQHVINSPNEENLADENN
jgi:hypothetical protein